MSLPTPSPEAIAALAPTGTLRAAINLSNFLLVTGKSEAGDPQGVSPDMAQALADQLGVGLELKKYKTPAEIADSGDAGAWDVGNIGAEPARAKSIRFTAAYCEIECTYLVPAGSPITTVEEADQPGMRIASAHRAAYDVWLEANLKHAERVNGTGLAGALELFIEQKCDALAGLRPALIKDVDKVPGATILDGRFTAVQQAMGTPRERADVGIEYLSDFVEAAKSTGLVTELIAKHSVVGLSVAGPA